MREGFNDQNREGYEVAAEDVIPQVEANDIDIRLSADNCFNGDKQEEMIEELLEDTHPSTCKVNTSVTDDSGNDPLVSSRTSKKGDDVHSDFASKEVKNALLIFALQERHNLTDTAVEDIAALCNLVAGENIMPSSKYFYRKTFSSLKDMVQFHHFCKHCKSYLGIIEAAVSCKTCKGEMDKKSGIKEGNYFLYIPVKEQIKHILLKNCLGETINFHKESHIRNKRFICDICDGSMYKSIKSEIPQIHSLTVTFNCDGVPVFGSSKFSIHPILLTVNEINSQLRKTNVILASLWFGQGVCDAVARAQLQNMKQFNGEFGCGYCLHPGKVVDKNQGQVRVYPYVEDIQIRSARETESLATDAAASNSCIYGVKGPSQLLKLKNFIIILSMTPDSMHAIYLGIVRQFLDLWFHTKNHLNEYYIGKKLLEIDSRLLKIKPPKNISRTPRSLETRKFWKAHELYSWLLFYSIPVLQGIIRMKYLSHWSLLVDSMHILLGENIPLSEVYRADNLLKEFVKNVEFLYGVQHMRYNVHLCMHLAKFALLWGPLWTQSAFNFENFNGQLLKTVNSSQFVSQQICSHILLKQALPFITINCLHFFSEEVKYFINKMGVSSKVHKNANELCNKITLLGTIAPKKVSKEYRLAMAASFINISENDTIISYKKIVVIVRNSIQEIVLPQKKETATL